jgi:hypothetical protein
MENIQKQAINSTIKVLAMVLGMVIASHCQSTTSTCFVTGQVVNCTTTESQPRQNFATGFQQANGSQNTAELGVAIGQAIRRHREEKRERKAFCSANPDYAATAKECKKVK